MMFIVLVWKKQEPLTPSVNERARHAPNIRPVNTSNLLIKSARVDDIAPQMFSHLLAALIHFHFVLQALWQESRCENVTGQTYQNVSVIRTQYSSSKAGRWMISHMSYVMFVIENINVSEHDSTCVGCRGETWHYSIRCFCLFRNVQFWVLLLRSCESLSEGDRLQGFSCNCDQHCNEDSNDSHVSRPQPLFTQTSSVLCLLPFGRIPRPSDGMCNSESDLWGTESEEMNSPEPLNARHVRVSIWNRARWMCCCLGLCEVWS